MAKKQQKKPKTDWRRIFVAVLAAALALLMLLPMLTMILGGAAGAVTQEEIDALKEQRAESQARQQELKEQLAGLKAGLEEAKEKRRILVSQLEAINGELENINAQIVWYDGQIAEKEEERAAAVLREQEQYDLFCRRVRAMEESGKASYWSILFTAESFSDLLDRLADISDIMAYDQAVMDQLIATREEIERLKAELESARAEQEAMKADLESKQAEQKEKVAEAQRLLDQINADTAEVNRQLEEESAAAQAIQASIVAKQKALEEERRRNNIIINSESGYLWPLPGYYRLSSLFGYRIHPITGKAHSHTGIDIPAPSGTPILAAKSGQVVTSGWHDSYGNYVVVDHGNGNSTLYAHMSARSVSEGQMVSQGQEVGKVGTTGSSNGNHLHYEVRDNYSRVNPEKKYSGLNLTHPW
ncbi:MAG: peptidoglycan DD-metalloendopeptidase family protein [Flavonifractor sp.]|jgi:murein DD-endopeptidase MepM/ murein hydrolase activator NlpD|nr:peptidoglycan DD-metalloendopeptidase family protein [Flavonifractor sp.]MCI9424131.1 peptidoglycan DD-metalloendopeptidase family protein [Flavonifractor sp.]